MGDALGSTSFSGHETFSFRYGWLKKGLDAQSLRATIFSDDDAMTVLGVGKNMVRSMRHWCLATRVLEDVETPRRRRGESLRPSAFGKAVFSDRGLDPYLEDLGTAWLLHWQLASLPDRATSWFWAFNWVHEMEFTKEALVAALERWIAVYGSKQVSRATLQRDIDCLLHTYVAPRAARGAVLEDSLDCPLVELGLIRQTDETSTYSFNRGAQPRLSDAVLLYAVLDFWNREKEHLKTLSLYDLAHAPGSPGRVLKLDEDSLAARAEQFERLTHGRVVYDETAGLKQLFRKGVISPADSLRMVYRRTLQHAG